MLTSITAGTSKGTGVKNMKGGTNNNLGDFISPSRCNIRKQNGLSFKCIGISAVYSPGCSNERKMFLKYFRLVHTQ